MVFETFELILCQMLSSQGKNAPSNPYPHYVVRLATSRELQKFGVLEGVLARVLVLGGVPTTPDPNTSTKASRYKWEPYRDTNWWRIYYSLPRGGHTFAKVSR